MNTSEHYMKLGTRIQVVFPKATALAYLYRLRATVVVGDILTETVAVQLTKYVISS